MQEAVRPLERSRPKWKVTLPAGFVLGLLLSAGVAMLLEFMNTTVRTPQDVARHAAMPVLGMVPLLDDEEVRIDNVEQVTRLAPRSMIAECFRRTRTNLLFSCPPDRQRTVLITSAQPEEGKTAVAVNLAVASAQSGRKVLLVDCNFRRPCLHQTFPQLGKSGLSNLLIGQCELKDLVTNTDIPTLDVMAAGPTPPNPAELLGSTYFKAFLSEAAAIYDQVLLDGPPGLLVSDALIAATAVDGVIVVTRGGSTSRGALRRLRDTLDRVGAHVLGAVLNAAEVQAGGYFKEMYRTYYDYDEQAGKVLPDGEKKSATPRKRSSRPRMTHSRGPAALRDDLHPTSPIHRLARSVHVMPGSACGAQSFRGESIQYLPRKNDQEWLPAGAQKEKPTVGVEPTTCALRKHRSTTESSRPG